MMKRLIVLFIAVCVLAICAAAQSTPAPTPTPTTPQASPSAPANPQATPVPTPRARKHGNHRGAAIRDINDPRVKELMEKHHAEKRACKTNPQGEGCANLAARQKSENRQLRMTLKKEGKI